MVDLLELFEACLTLDGTALLRLIWLFLSKTSPGKTLHLFAHYVTLHCLDKETITSEFVSSQGNQIGRLDFS